MNTAISDLTLTDFVAMHGFPVSLLKGPPTGLNQTLLPPWRDSCVPNPLFQLRFSANPVKEFGFLCGVSAQ